MGFNVGWSRWYITDGWNYNDTKPADATHTIEYFVSEQALLTDFSQGEYKTLTCAFKLPQEMSDRKETVVSATFTVKAFPTNTTNIFEITITPQVAEIADVGYIDQVFNSNFFTKFQFDLTGTDTALLTFQQDYYYAIKYITSGTKNYTFKTGVIRVNKM